MGPHQPPQVGNAAATARTTWTALFAFTLIAGINRGLPAQNAPQIPCSAAYDSIKAQLVAEACLQEALKAGNEGGGTGTAAAISSAHRAVQAAASAGEHQIHAKALIIIAQGYRRLMRFDSVLTYANEAAALGRRWQDQQLQAAAVATLSMAYSMLGRPDSAFRLGSSLMELCPAPCSLYIPVATLLSRFYPDSARRSLLGFLEVSTRRGDQFGRGRVLDELGLYYSEVLHQYDTALAYHRAVDSLKVVDEWSIYGMGRAFRGLKMVDSAETYFRLQLYMARRSGAGWSEAYALGNLGQMCHRDLPQPLLNCAIDYYDSTATLVAKMLNEVGADDNRTTVADFAAEIYEDLVFAFLAYKGFPERETAARAGLAASEFGRSLGLLHLMTREGRLSKPVGEQTILDEPKRDSLGFLRSLGSTTYTLSYLLGKDTLLTWLTLPGQRVRLSRKAVPNDSVIKVVGAVREELGIDNVFVNSRLRGVPSRTPRVQKRYDASSSGVLRRAAEFLLPRDLIDLVPPGADLVVVPHHALTALPFAVLPVPGGQGEELGVRNPVRYTPSLKIMERLQRLRLGRSRTGRTPDLTSAMVVSDPQMPLVDLGLVVGDEPEGKRALSELPSSLAEGEWIAKRLRASNLTGKEATETRVRRDMPSAALLHFATHAVAAEYSNFARSSFLATAQDSANDGLLTAGELLDSPELSISASLVVLSACQTAVGPLRVVEGTIGLQRAFLARGAETVLASLWSVNDESTALLMKRFYSHLLDDPDKPSKAESLKRAQADVRAAPGFAHPIYWAGFQIIGLN